MLTRGKDAYRGVVITASRDASHLQRVKMLTKGNVTHNDVNIFTKGNVTYNG